MPEGHEEFSDKIRFVVRSVLPVDLFGGNLVRLRFSPFRMVSEGRGRSLLFPPFGGPPFFRRAYARLALAVPLLLDLRKNTWVPLADYSLLSTFFF